jgi:hypothetical protein
MKNLKLYVLLGCGILSSVWYVIINLYVPMRYEGYSMAMHTVSELSAIGAPTRSLWVTLVAIYPLLFAAFGWGVWQVANNKSLKIAGRNKSLKIVGGLIIFYSAFNLYWPPMHMRGFETSITDTLHLVWAFVTILLMLAMMAFSATTFGKAFRLYTLTSIVLHVLFGVLTSLEAPNIPNNGPTPMIGVWERINIGIFMLWVVVFAGMIIYDYQSNKSGRRYADLPKKARVS